MRTLGSHALFPGVVGIEFQLARSRSTKLSRRARPCAGERVLAQPVMAWNPSQEVRVRLATSHQDRVHERSRAARRNRRQAMRCPGAAAEQEEQKRHLQEEISFWGT